MGSYHPPKMITTNAAPAITADLAYEGHGKCGCQTIILSDISPEGVTPVLEWDATNPDAQPSLPSCDDYSHVYKIVALVDTKFRTLTTTNIPADAIAPLLVTSGAFVLQTGSEILADFTFVRITAGTCILYRDCDQS